MSGSVSRIVSERNHRTLLELVCKPGNDVCADCKARAPRWASYNLGIFICVNCASIHRKIGTHVTKVKSITLDEWTKDQVEVMKEYGNTKSNALYNPNEARHPPPANMVDSERDSELERFIRSKYEYKRFMDRKPGGFAHSAQMVRKTSPAPLPPPKTPQNLPLRLHTSTTMPSLSPNMLPPPRSASQPLPPLNADKLNEAPPLRQQPAVARKPVGEVWQDLISLGGPSQSSSLPLQYSPMTPMASFPSQPQVTVQQSPAMPTNASNPFMNLSMSQVNPTTPLVTSPLSVSIPGTPGPFVSSAPLSSPALHLGAANPFNQAPLLLSNAGNAAAFSTSSNPFSSSHMPMSMTMSTPTTPVMALPTGTLLHRPSLPFISSQTPMQTSIGAFSYPTASFAPAHNATTTGMGQNLLAPSGIPGQMPLAAGGVTNPFSSMQMGQAGFSGAAGASPQTAFLNQPPLYPQQQSHGYGGWAGQGAPGMHGGV